MRNPFIAVFAVAAVAVGVNAVVSAQSPYPSPPGPSTTIPVGDLETCHIEGIAAVMDPDDTVGDPTPIGVNVFLKCAVSSTRTETFTLYLDDGHVTESLAEFIDQIDGLVDDGDEFEVH